MSILIATDPFNSLALGAGWEENTGAAFGTFDLNGFQVQPQLEIPISQGAATAIRHRAVLTSIDPLNSFPAAGVGTVIDIEYQARITLPNPLPDNASNQYMSAGIMMLCPNNISDQGGVRIAYEIDSAGNHFLLARQVQSNNASTIISPLTQNLTATGRALAAGSSFILRGRIRSFGSTSVYSVYMSWDQEPAVEWFFPVAGNLNNFNGHGGIYIEQFGKWTATTVSTGVGSTLSTTLLLDDRTKLDDFTITDKRSVTFAEFFPAPTQPTALSLSRATFASASEGNAGGSFSVQPTFAVPLNYIEHVGEFRAADGNVRNFPRTSTDRRVWSLTWASLNDTEKDAVWNTIVSANGVLQDITYTPPASTAIQVRGIKAPTLVNEGASHWSITAEVVEIF